MLSKLSSKSSKALPGLPSYGVMSYLTSTFEGPDIAGARGRFPAVAPRKYSRVIPHTVARLSTASLSLGLTLLTDSATAIHASERFTGSVTVIYECMHIHAFRAFISTDLIIRVCNNNMVRQPRIVRAFLGYIVVFTLHSILPCCG